MMRFAFLRRTVIAGFSAALFSGCSGGGTTPTQTTSGGGPGGAQASEIGSALQDEVEATISSMTVPEMTTPIGLSVTAGCPAAGGSLDTDGDGIPDDLTLTFANPPCSFNGFRGGSVNLSGTVRIQDANSTNIFDLTESLTNLIFDFAGPGGTKSFTATRNGTRSIAADSTGLTMTEIMNVVRQRPARANATISHTGTITFTADPDKVFLPTQPLPAGTLDFGGSFTWQRSTENFQFTITTPTPLRYDPTCGGTAQRIRSGELRASGTIGTANGYEQLLWTACGVDPTRTFVTVP